MTSEQTEQLLDTAVITKEYDYGLRDATLFVTDKGFFVYDSLRMVTTHHSTFQDADGRANIIKALNR